MKTNTYHTRYTGTPFGSKYRKNEKKTPLLRYIHVAGPKCHHRLYLSGLLKLLPLPLVFALLWQHQHQHLSLPNAAKVPKTPWVAPILLVRVHTHTCTWSQRVRKHIEYVRGRQGATRTWLWVAWCCIPAHPPWHYCIPAYACCVPECYAYGGALFSFEFRVCTADRSSQSPELYLRVLIFEVHHFVEEP